VTIVEKNAALGGYAARQRKQIPTKAPYSELEPTNIQEKIKEITNHPRITVKTGFEIARISGAPASSGFIQARPAQNRSGTFPAKEKRGR
jgi:quinone-modifying oxidoreductase subunit QmoB